MSYPKLKINLSKIKQNVSRLVKMCNEKDIKVAGVTKVFCANKDIVSAYIDGGVSYLADSRMQNLKKLKDIDIKKIMLRLPMKSEVGDIVQYADISLNSEIDTIRELSKKAIEIGKIHNIVLMVDLGDLREGYYYNENLMKAVEEIIQLQGVDIVGLGTNMTCYGAVIPKPQDLQKLIEIKENIEKKYSLKLEIISGGNSSSIHLLEENDLDINNLRLGESLVLGKETAYGEQIEGTVDDAFILQVEVIETKEKPSIPTGEIGKDAFGNIPTFIDRGVRKRTICAIGKQDIDIDALNPLDLQIIILGASSDHLILDTSDSKNDYKVGDVIEFKLSYGGILSAMTSPYIDKDIE